MSSPLTASTIGSATAVVADSASAMTMMTMRFILELHRRAGATGEPGDRLVASCVADADAEADTVGHLAREVVIQPDSGFPMSGRKRRDLDGRRHRPLRHGAPA